MNFGQLGPSLAGEVMSDFVWVLEFKVPDDLFQSKCDSMLVHAAGSPCGVEIGAETKSGASPVYFGGSAEVTGILLLPVHLFEIAEVHVECF